MAKQGLVPTNNQQHKVWALLAQGRSSLRALARAYFLTEVAGQAPATVEAKGRDLGRFFSFYLSLYGQVVRLGNARVLAPDREGGVSEATLAGTYASVRHFAR